MAKSIPVDYAQAVVSVLRPYFPDLEEPITAEVIQEAIQRHVATPTDMFECLLDARGSWRLRRHRSVESRVRVACYRFNESDADRGREEMLNALLDDLS